MYSYELYSHPNKLLKDHLNNVKNIGINIFRKENLNCILNEDVLKAILLFHDFGKASSFFQDKLFNRENHNINLTYHSDISALACMFYLENEHYSNAELSLAFLAIKKHHGNLYNNLKNSDINETTDELFYINEDKQNYLKEIVTSINFNELEKIYEADLKIKEFKELLIHNIDTFSLRKYRKELKKCLNEDYSFFLKLNMYFSLLVYSDKKDCIFDNTIYENICIQFTDFDAVDKYKQEKFNYSDINNKNFINEIREKSYKEVENNINTDFKIFSINLPTGTGKTLTALNASLKLLRQDPRLIRIIYCLPFTSIIDQNADIFHKVIKSEDNAILLKHHHLSEINYSSRFYKDEIFNDNQAENLIESWDSKIIITTFYQFLNTIFTGSNRLLKKLNKIHNSILILDEVQTIPRKYWLLINKYFNYLTQKLNIYIILVTATMPMIFSEKNNEIVELATSKELYFKYLNRINLDVSSLQGDKNMSIVNFCEDLYSEIIKNETKSYLIILNTINCSLYVYKFLVEKGLSIEYLSSNIIPKHRLSRIKDIKKKLNRNIVVSTQVVEAGVDIDFDIVYRDFAPLDSIFQACGRCNRNGRNNEKGIVKIIQLTNESGKKYSSFIYDTVNLSKTLNIFQNKGIIEENKFYDIANQYFDEMKKVTENTTSLNILNAMCNLNYKEAFYDKNSFKLIEENFQTISVFIEVDDEATAYLHEYHSLLADKKQSFEINTKIKKLYTKMSQYIINVSKKFISTNDEEKLFVINKDTLDNFYDKNTGYIRSNDQDDFIF